MGRFNAAHLVEILNTPLRTGNLFPSAILVLLLAVPGLWRLGLDQGAWVALSLLLGTLALRRPSTRLTVLMVAFVGIVALSGVLGAQGYRWITFSRELVIVATFFAVVLGVSTLRESDRALRYLIVGLAFVMAVSSVSSIVAFLAQGLFLFKTPIASLVPDAIASTRLGELSFTDRSLGTSSFFLGHIFVRPHGLFLFSTSQAVAQAVATPILLAATWWFPALRWWLWAVVVVTVAALITTTTRMPILALPLSFLGAMLAESLVNQDRSWLWRNQRRLGLAGVLASVLLLGAVLSGVGESVAEMMSARSLGPRSALYVATIERWTERPFLGWGTEVDWEPNDAADRGDGIAEVDSTQLPPLGSHSQYFGVLFKQGAAGVVTFAAILALLAMNAKRALLEGRPSIPLVAAFGTTLLVGLTESIWLDPGAAFVVATAWGLVAQAPHRQSLTPVGRHPPQTHMKDSSWNRSFSGPGSLSSLPSH